MVKYHKPLYLILNTYRQGSIKTDRIKLEHRDIKYQAVYQKEGSNKSDYLSQCGKPLELIPENKQEEAEDLHNYTIFT